MPARKTFCLPSLVTTFIALILLILVTISVPLTTHSSSPFYIVEAKDLNGTVTDGTGNGANANRDLTAVRAGIWGYCSQGVGESSYGYCSDNNHQWNVTFDAVNSTTSDYGSVSIGPSWTRGLVVAVVAMVFTAVGFALSFFPHLIVQLVAAFVLFLAMLLTFIAFIIQIAFYVYFLQRIHRVTESRDVMPGAGFYMTLICIPLLAFSMVTVFCGWRSDKAGNAPSAGYGASGAGAGAGAYGSDMETGTGRKGRFAAPWKRNRGAAGAGAGAGNGTVNDGYGQRSYDDGHNKDSIPLSSRQKVLDAYHSS